ncbi:hypothetical protein CBR_g39283 [Chara braunii]|uniref:Uncharacterized protein n=1 Tax=Chara braunii TaxID=69332 RepID=A0A388K100_CHABU|nr:hypothetical protein CBR_g39283 [Chara braunii]|eukprot:GBG63740.1 hypothetical protein CBR_g39283 [Chara braunii]
MCLPTPPQFAFGSCELLFHDGLIGYPKTVTAPCPYDVPSFSDNGWYPDLLVGDSKWLDAFHALARSAQTLISLAPPKIVDFVRLHSVGVSSLLITTLSFDLWTDLLWNAANDKAAFLNLAKYLVTQSKEIVDEDELVSICVDVEIAMKETIFVDLFGPESNFHADVVQRDLVAAEDGVESEEEGEEEEEDSLLLTEEENVYHAKLLTEGRNDKIKAVAANQKFNNNKYVCNAFLLIVPPRWVESQSTSVEDKLWDLYTFNYLAPIHADSYRFLASLTEEEMKKYNEKALT